MNEVSVSLDHVLAEDDEVELMVRVRVRGSLREQRAAIEEHLVELVRELVA